MIMITMMEMKQMVKMMMPLMMVIMTWVDHRVLLQMIISFKT